MSDSPRVLHLNDCAFVGANIIAAAARAGHTWRMLPDPWAKLRPGETVPTKAAEVTALRRRWIAQARAQVVHVHYGRTARLVFLPFMPPRPYVLHLHGTDIRTLWKDPAHHDRIQTAIDRAQHVFYTTRDLEDNATSARADAEYMPVFVDLAQLPAWAPARHEKQEQQQRKEQERSEEHQQRQEQHPREGNQQSEEHQEKTGQQKNAGRNPEKRGRRVVFASRWDPSKGAEGMVRLAARLRKELPADVDLVGLDWGVMAPEAAAAGVRLTDKMDHATYLNFLAESDLAIAQTNTVLGVSEVEAMGIGVPLAGLGEHLPGPDGNPIPMLDGTLDDVVDQVLAAVADPEATARTLAPRDWVARNHTADPYIPHLLDVYEEAIQTYKNRERSTGKDLARMARTATAMVFKRQ